MGELPLELFGLVEIGHEILNKQDEICEEGQEPEGGAPLPPLLGVLIEDFDFGEDVDVVAEPVEREEPSDGDVEDVVQIAGQGNQLFYLLGFVDALEQTEQLPGVPHVG